MPVAVSPDASHCRCQTYLLVEKVQVCGAFVTKVLRFIVFVLPVCRVVPLLLFIFLGVGGIVVVLFFGNVFTIYNESEIVC